MICSVNHRFPNYTLATARVIERIVHSALQIKIREEETSTKSPVEIQEILSERRNLYKLRTRLLNVETANYNYNRFVYGNQIADLLYHRHSLPMWIVKNMLAS